MTPIMSHFLTMLLDPDTLSLLVAVALALALCAGLSLVLLDMLLDAVADCQCWLASRRHGADRSRKQRVATTAASKPYRWQPY